MKVSELIEALQKFPQDANVSVIEEPDYGPRSTYYRDPDPKIDGFEVTL